MKAKTKQVPLLDLLCHGFPSVPREKLLAHLFCGDVRIDGEKCRDPKRLCNPQAKIQVLGLEVSSFGEGGIPPLPYVSRGGYKLAGALEAWSIDVGGKVCLDAGSSTGGFTHCLLLQGASVVHAVDVGYNQLDWRLRNLPQVQVRERCNIMGLTDLDPQPAMAFADLSFRSLANPARRIVDLCSEGVLYGLVKPQFERRYQKKEADDYFTGISHSSEHRAILLDLAKRLEALHLEVSRIAPSTLPGTKGNQEYFFEIKDGGGQDNEGRILTFFQTLGQASP